MEHVATTDSGVCIFRDEHGNVASYLTLENIYRS